MDEKKFKEKLNNKLVPLDVFFAEVVPAKKNTGKFENEHRINIPKYGFISQGIKIPANPISLIIDPNTILKRNK
jgi:hypothetical protein